MMVGGCWMHIHVHCSVWARKTEWSCGSTGEM